MGTSRWPVASSDAGFAPYLAGVPEASAAIFGRFLGLARAAGPATIVLMPQKPELQSHTYGPYP
jgi:hypothetical protein